MAQQTSPFLESKYGWAYGESGWNQGMDENLLKFSYLFDSNIDGIVASLPPAESGKAYFLSSDNRIYFSVGTSYYSSPIPKWFVLTLRNDGSSYQFNGSSLVAVASSSNITTRLNEVESELDGLGTASTEDVEYFATPAQLDVASAQAAAFTTLTVNTFKQELADPNNTSNGSSLVGWRRSQLSSVISNVGESLSANAVNIWEFANYVTNKPTVNDPSTWDWTPAFTAALVSIASTGGGPVPLSTDGSLIIPVGKFKVTSVEVPQRVSLVFQGGTLARFDDAARSHLIKFIGFNRVYNLTIDMDYSILYDTAVWCRGRYIDFVNPEIWRAKCAYVFGDPAWESNPAQGILGDSEITINGGSTNWGITVARVYGQNSIIHFGGGHKAYSYKPAMGEQNPSDPRLSSWNALTEYTFINCGGLIYLTGCVTGNFSAQAANFYSKLQPVSGDPAYVNSFGRFYVNGTHMETGLFLTCAPVGAFTADDSRTVLLQMSGCHGYLSVTPGYLIDAGGDCQQAIDVRACGFYGGIQNKICYSVSANVHVEKSSFSNYTTDFYQTLQVRYPTGYVNFCPLNLTTSSQTFSPTLSNFKPTVFSDSDVNAGFNVSWYNASTGACSIQTSLKNAEVFVNLALTGGLATDTTDIVLVVNGTTVDILSAVGGNPRGTLRAQSIPKGATLEIKVAQYQSRSANGTASNHMMITGNT